MQMRFSPELKYSYIYWVAHFYQHLQALTEQSIVVYTDKNKI